MTAPAPASALINELLASRRISSVEADVLRQACGRDSWPTVEPSIVADMRSAIDQVEADLKARRVRRAEFLVLADVSPSTWTRWKSGDRSATLSTWKRCEDALDEIKRRFPIYCVPARRSAPGGSKKDQFAKAL